jgi:hypothetical protein
LTPLTPRTVAPGYIPSSFELCPIPISVAGTLPGKLPYCCNGQSLPYLSDLPAILLLLSDQYEVRVVHRAIREGYARLRIFNLVAHVRAQFAANSVLPKVNCLPSLMRIFQFSTLNSSFLPLLALCDLSTSFLISEWPFARGPGRACCRRP